MEAVVAEVSNTHRRATAKSLLCLQAPLLILRRFEHMIGARDGGRRKSVNRCCDFGPALPGGKTAEKLRVRIRSILEKVRCLIGGHVVTLNGKVVREWWIREDWKGE